jgi:hypothetical protein
MAVSLAGENWLAAYEVRLSIKVLESAPTADDPPTGLRRTAGNRTRRE